MMCLERNRSEYGLPRGMRLPAAALGIGKGGSVVLRLCSDAEKKSLSQDDDVL